MLRTSCCKYALRSSFRPVVSFARAPRFESTVANPQKQGASQPVDDILRADDGLPLTPSTMGRKFHEARANQKDWDNPILTYEQVKAMSLSPTPNVYLIDVREPDEVMQGSIPSSVNLPLSSIGGDLHKHPEAFKEQHGFDKPNIDQEIVFYCRSGKRSASACDIAKRNGYTSVSNYEGSWLDWLEKEGKNKSS